LEEKGKGCDRRGMENGSSEGKQHGRMAARKSYLQNYSRVEGEKLLRSERSAGEIGLGERGGGVGRKQARWRTWWTA